ncbi:MAG: ATP-dependent sacrificial sulfur transferase LarE [Spirochaetaceae bacterium]|nr:ATP-dependent sacrificial sulfur transferase LarE [Spirochaetaceae bacterium]
MSSNEKYEQLLRIIREQEAVAVAFSGGVDSSFLCYAAVQALKDKALAITVVSPMLPKTEIDWAKRIAVQTGIRHILIEENDIDSAVAANPRDRCYHCKKIEFGTIIAEAKKAGAKTVLDGSNMDDENDYRPGLKALAELAVLSPLRQAGLNKTEIRELSKQAGLPTWDKPAFACLASRFPYGEHITVEKLAQVESAEEIVRHAGFVNFRVRYHGTIARIEVAPEERAKFFNILFLDTLSAQIKQCGFLYAAFELEGYRMGSLNAVSTTEK